MRRITCPLCGQKHGDNWCAQTGRFLFLSLEEGELKDKDEETKRYRIKCIPKFRTDTEGRVLTHLVSMENGEYIFGYTDKSKIATWGTREEAQAVVEELYNYYRPLMLGETALPEYEIFDDNDEYALNFDCLRGEWEREISSERMPEQVCTVLNMEIVKPGGLERVGVYDNSHVVYGCCVVVDRIKYCKNYIVHSIKEQLSGGKISWVDLQYGVYTCEEF